MPSCGGVAACTSCGCSPTLTRRVMPWKRACSLARERGIHRVEVAAIQDYLQVFSEDSELGRVCPSFLPRTRAKPRASTRSCAAVNPTGSGALGTGSTSQR